MAIRNIVKDGDDILHKKCREVIKFDQRLWVLLDDMAETMYDADGVGLAGPQVGVLRRVGVIDISEDLIELVNPVVIKTEGEQETAEGCLSFPGEYGMTKRPMFVTVKAQDRNGKFFEISGKELLAKALCHEIDHLDGIVYKDIVIRMLSPEEIE